MKRKLWTLSIPLITALWTSSCETKEELTWRSCLYPSDFRCIEVDKSAAWVTITDDEEIKRDCEEQENARYLVGLCPRENVAIICEPTSGERQGDIRMVHYHGSGVSTPDLPELCGDL